MNFSIKGLFIDFLWLVGRARDLSSGVLSALTSTLALDMKDK